MKYLATVLLMLHSLIFTNCFAQSPNQKVIDVNGREKLLGKVEKEAFVKDSFAAWFTPNYEKYQVDSETLKSIKNELKKYKIKVFMGTWCGDSKREIPKFYKILEAAYFPLDRLDMIAVDYLEPYYKKSPDGEEKGLGIIKVPTFIFLKEGKEVNRIVESPIISLEKDIEAIMTGKNYVPNYSKLPNLPQD